VAKQLKADALLDSAQLKAEVAALQQEIASGKYSQDYGQGSFASI
jgi:hypothetical protein